MESQTSVDSSSFADVSRMFFLIKPLYFVLIMIMKRKVVLFLNVFFFLFSHRLIEKSLFTSIERHNQHDITCIRSAVRHYHKSRYQRSIAHHLKHSICKFSHSPKFIFLFSLLNSMSVLILSVWWICCLNSCGPLKSWYDLFYGTKHSKLLYFPYFLILSSLRICCFLSCGFPHVNSWHNSHIV